MKKPKTAVVISFSAASFPPIKDTVRENSLQGRKCFSSFPSRKQGLLLTRELRERPSSRQLWDRWLTPKKRNLKE